MVLRGHQAPEAYLDVAAQDTDVRALGDLVGGLDREIQSGDPELPLAGFRQVVRGVRSWHERFGGTMVRR